MPQLKLEGEPFDASPHANNSSAPPGTQRPHIEKAFYALLTARLHGAGGAP